MASKKVKESRTSYTAQDVDAKQTRSRRFSVPKAKPRTIGQSKSGTASRRSRAAQTKGDFFADGGLDEINQNLLELKAGLVDIQQRLSAVEEQLSFLSDAQKRSETISASVADEAGWLKLSESAFVFWDNAEDDVYDTL